MKKWISCGGGFIEADVIRWTEGAWLKRGGRRSRGVLTGHRQVVAEVIREDSDRWVYLLVLRCAVLDEKTGHSVSALAAGEEVRRKRLTLARGHAERLSWSDESARAVIASRFLGTRA